MSQRKLIGMLAGIALTGCNGPAPTHRADCLDFHTTNKIDIGKLERNVRLARAILNSPPINPLQGWRDWLKEPLVPSDKFCEAFRGSVIIIRPESEFLCAEPTCDNQKGLCWGVAYADGSIQLERTGKALVHELIHVWDSQKLRPGNEHHLEWSETGRDQYHETFLMNFEPL